MIVPPLVKVGVIVAAIGYALLAAYGGGVKRATAEYEAKISAHAAADAKQAEADQRVARIKEKAATDALYAQAAQLLEVEKRAKTETDGLRADLRSARVRLSLPVTAPVCGVDRNSAAAAEPGAEARAELMPETADALVSIAVDGDSAVRQLNAVIDAYADLRGKYNEMVRVPGQ